MQVSRGSIRDELRPQHLKYFVARHAVTRSKCKQLHQIGGASLRPRVTPDRSRVHEHFEGSEQPDLKLTHTNQPYRRTHRPFGRQTRFCGPLDAAGHRTRTAEKSSRGGRALIGIPVCTAEAKLDALPAQVCV
jgi:hypothetical protein